MFELVKQEWNLCEISFQVKLKNSSTPGLLVLNTVSNYHESYLKQCSRIDTNCSGRKILERVITASNYHGVCSNNCLVTT